MVPLFDICTTQVSPTNDLQSEPITTNTPSIGNPLQPNQALGLTLVSCPIKDRTCWKVGKIISVSRTSLKNLFCYLPTYLPSYPLQDPLPRKKSPREKSLFSYLPTQPYPLWNQLPIDKSLFSYLPTYKTYPLQDQLPRKRVYLPTYLPTHILQDTLTTGSGYEIVLKNPTLG